MNRGTSTHWTSRIDDEGLLWLHLDRARASTNTVSPEVLAELDDHLEVLEADPPRAVIILSDKANGFIAGADVHEFTRIEDEDRALELTQGGQRVLDRLERLPCPTLSLIHGFCLGGGLELALACDYRVARDDAGTRLGLPEVRLGIHPGFGGTVRLPRVIGPPAALDLMLTGRTVDARRAARIGLVDHAVPERQLHNAARAVALQAPARHRPPRWQASLSWRPLRPLIAWWMARQVARRAPRRHYPAPYALIDLWARYAGDPGRMQEAEARSVARLIVEPTARNLVRVFLLQERLKSLARKDGSEIRRVHVVGAGTMGGDIAAWCALQGFHVSLQDRTPEQIAPAIARARGLLQKRLRRPHLVQDALDRLVPDPKGDGVARADVIVEAIYENAEAKQSLYRQLEPRMREDVVLATNTSSIPLQTLGEALASPPRLVGLHFFNPVARMQLVEVVHSPQTDAETAARAAAFARRIDKLPLPVASTPGFLVNRVLMPYLLEAVRLEAEGVPAEAIDKAATDFGMPMGPLRLGDAVGLDICLSVGEILAEAFEIEVPQRLRELVESGRVGEKSGHGFYRYQKGKPERRRLKRDVRPPSDLEDRLVLSLINEAVTCLREGVVEDADLLDAGLVYGTGFAPFRGGPIHHARQEGKDALLERLRALEQSHGDRFKPDPYWQEL